MQPVRLTENLCSLFPYEQRAVWMSGDLGWERNAWQPEAGILSWMPSITTTITTHLRSASGLFLTGPATLSPRTHTQHTASHHRFGYSSVFSLYNSVGPDSHPSVRSTPSEDLHPDQPQTSRLSLSLKSAPKPIQANPLANCNAHIFYLLLTP